MFGKNPLRSKTSDPTRLEVESHFYTIQGEGPYSGVPALFIRLSGCNLACHFCDTQFEENAEKFTPIEVLTNELEHRYTPAQRSLVVITGGEPMRQDFSLLAMWLLRNGTETIQVETAGTVWQPTLEPMIREAEIVLVCSPKTPKVHPKIEATCFHWKYVLTAGEIDPHDGLPNRGTQLATMNVAQTLYRASPERLGNTIWVSPCDSYVPEKNKANMHAARDVSMLFGYRLSLQVHKIVGVE